MSGDRFYQSSVCNSCRRDIRTLYFQFALKLRDKSEWYMDFFPLFQETYYVFLEAKKSLDPVVDFMIENVSTANWPAAIDSLFQPLE